MMNLVEYLHANRHEMSETDAAFVAERHRADIVALSHEEKELMSRFLERHFSFIFPNQVYHDHRHFLSSFTPSEADWFSVANLFGARNQTPSITTDGGTMSLYSDGKIRNLVRILAVIGSSVLPILSIVVLYVISSPNVRLGCIIIFSFLCSAVLATLSNAKNVEIIAATAA